MNTILFAGSATISVETHRATRGYAEQRRTFSTFNNIVIVGRGSEGWVLRGTRATLEGISKLGFDVRAHGNDHAGDAYTVRRPNGYRVVDTQGRAVDPSNDYRPFPLAFSV